MTVASAPASRTATLAIAVTTLHVRPANAANMTRSPSSFLLLTRRAALSEAVTRATALRMARTMKSAEIGRLAARATALRILKARTAPATTHPPANLARLAEWPRPLRMGSLCRLRLAAPRRLDLSLVRTAACPSTARCSS
eukprot:320921-Rhodomonas_salina.1